MKIGRKKIMLEGPLWKKDEFLGAKNVFIDARGAQTQYDVVWYFTPIFIFSALHIFYIKIATSEGEVRSAL